MSGADRPTLRFVKLDPRALAPKAHSPLAAGLDLAACLPRHEHTSERVVIEPGAIVKIPIGIVVAVPEGYEGQVRPRSGLATRFGVTVPNAPGTIDADYRGEAFVALINLGREPYLVHHGERVAQLVIAPIARAQVVEVEELEDTQRGVGGFGSTGRH